MLKVMSRHIFILLIFCLTASSLALADNYKVGPGDVLSIIVFDEPEASGTVEVTQKGEIQHVLLGQISVIDMRTEEITELFVEKLRKFIRQPRVSITVVEYKARKVYVFGGVARPGTYPLKENTALLEILIADAGGPKETTGTISILRNYLKGNEQISEEELEGIWGAESDQPREVLLVDFNEIMSGREGSISQNVRLEDGDIIYIPSSDLITDATKTVYVFGAVQNPGIFPIERRNFTALNAVLAAGGFTNFASKNRVRLIRRIGDHREEKLIRLGDVMRGQRDKDVLVQANDILVVPEGLF